MATSREAARRLQEKHEIQEEAEEDLDRDDALAQIRERRLLELKQSMNKLDEMKQKGHGALTEVTVEKDFLKLTTTTKLVVAHFCHKQFRRCQILDAHLQALAPKHFGTKFVKIDVENAPFFVDKLQIKVLPCLVSFLNGVITDKMVGFEMLGNADNFATEALEKRLIACGVVNPNDVRAPVPAPPKPIFGSLSVDTDDIEDIDMD